MPEKIYALLLRLYPSEFRHTYGREALQLIRDRARNERGVVLQLRLFLDLTTDLFAATLRSRRDRFVIAADDVHNGVPSFQVLEWAGPRPVPLAAGMLLAIVMMATFTQVIHAVGPEERLTQLRTLTRLRAGFVQSSRLGSRTAPQSRPTDQFIAKLVENRYALSVRGGQLSGAGAQGLQSAIAQSRFVLLGEYHGVAQTPEFWAAVCKAAGPQGFHTMAVEEGPLAAAELEGWAGRPDGLEQFVAFKKKFPESIGVANAREEFDMLQQCARVGQGEFRLWGLNQEMFGAGGLILSRVLASGVGTQSRAAIQQLLQKNDEANRKAQQSGSIFDLFMIAADDKELAAGAALLQKDGSAEARSLFASLVESHEINRRPPVEYGNARRREQLMKRIFAANYARAALTAPAPPKVLLKFGGYHVYRGLNPVHGRGIGNYVAEFAEGQAAQSLHILFLAAKGSQPIHPRAGQPAQLRPFTLENDPGFRYLQPAFSNLLPADWTMFDLRPLRADVNRPGAALSTEWATLVFGFDILVIVPEGTGVTEIG